MTLSVPDILNHPQFKGKWYHNIELAPGIWTDGGPYRNIALTRRLLARSEVEGKNCLDIGAQDCLVTLLLSRRGARTAVAQDVQFRPEKIAFIRDVTDQNFDYFGGTMQDISGQAKELGTYPFDVVIFSGVLYHMIDPFAGLAICRSLVRTGGLFLLETSAIISDSNAAYLNVGGRYFQGTNYWQISLRAMDYFLRFCRFMPLDAQFFLHTAGKDICRIAVMCRAVDEVPIERSDDWAHRSAHKAILGHYFDLKSLASDQSDVTYTSDHTNELAYRDDGLGISVYETVLREPDRSHRTVQFESECRLALGQLT